MKAVDYFCGFLGIALITSFLGGLAYSIWDNTASIAFPLITAAVLLMVYVAFFNEIKSGPDHT